jgi:hypothetical protein
MISTTTFGSASRNDFGGVGECPDITPSNAALVEFLHPRNGQKNIDIFRDPRASMNTPSTHLAVG